MKPLVKLILCGAASWLLAEGYVFSMDDIPADQLPPRVMAAIKQDFKEAVIVSVKRDNGRNDFVYYLVNIRQANKEKIIEINENGMISKPEAGAN
jgi:anaerobic ribonucleoside-triphosphate reductase